MVIRVVRLSSGCSLGGLSVRTSMVAFNSMRRRSSSLSFLSRSYSSSLATRSGFIFKFENLFFEKNQVFTHSLLILHERY